MRILRILLYIIFLLNGISLFSQNQLLSGKVYDVENKPVSGVLVIVSNELNELITYAYTSKEGSFNFKFKNKDNKIKVDFESLGYEKFSMYVNDFKNNNQNLNIVLTEKIVVLNEVIVQSKLNTDTTKIQVQQYINQTEQTVEDILKKIPGIEVLDDGSIKAYGKFIDKLLVEGDDVLNKNYKLLSKNLDAKVIDEVQILSNFEDNPVLKKLFQSEKVALNLKLKKDKHNIWFGNINLGAGVFSENSWKEGLNIGLLRKKIKLFYFADYNNSGEKATDVLMDNIYEDDTYGIDRYERKTSHYYNIGSNENTSLGKTQSIFNKALLNSLNFTTKVKPNFTLRGVTYVTNDNQVQYSYSQSQFNVDTQPITFKEDTNYKSNKTLAGTEIEAKYYPNDRNYITNILIYKNNPSIISSNTFFNTSDINQNTNRKNQTIYNHFNHTFTINKSAAINNYVYFGIDNKTNINRIKSALLNNFLNINEAGFINQDFDNTIQYFGVKSKFLSKYKKIEYSIAVNYENNKETISNTFIADGISNATYENNVVLEQHMLKSTTSLRFRFSKKLYFTSTLNHTLNNFNLNNSRNLIYILNFSNNFNYDLTKAARLALSFTKNNSIPDTGTLLNKPILTNFRSFSTGTTYEKPLENSSIFLSYYLLKDAKRYAVNASISYSDTKTTVGSENQLNPNFSFLNYIYTKGGENVAGNLGFTKYVRLIKSSFKIETSHNINKNLIKINSNEFQLLNNYLSFYKLTARSYLTGPFNFDFNFTYNQSQSNFNRNTTKNNTRDAAFNITYKPKETLIFELTNKYYNINNDNYYFTNGVINYTPKESRFSYRIVLNNLFNINQFTILNIDNYTSSSQSINLIPRYFLANVKFRF